MSGKVVVYGTTAALQFERQHVSNSTDTTINIDAATVSKGKANWSSNKWIVSMTDLDLVSFVGFSIGAGGAEFKMTNRGDLNHFLTVKRNELGRFVASFTASGEPARAVSLEPQEVALIGLIALSCLRSNFQITDGSILEMVRSLPVVSGDKKHEQR
jgi:hypothetical protein